MKSSRLPFTSMILSIFFSPEDVSGAANAEIVSIPAIQQAADLEIFIFEISNLSDVILLRLCPGFHTRG